MPNELKKIGGMLSLAKKAGKVVTGEESCEKAIQKGEAQLILVATDASDNTKKKFTNKSNYYNVPLYSIFNKENLSSFIGMNNRATIVINCQNFGKKILEMMLTMEGKGG